MTKVYEDLIISEIKSMKELFDVKMNNLEDSFATKISNVDDNLKKVAEEVKGVSLRVTVIELWRANSVGRITVITTLIGIFISVSVAWVSHFFKS